MCSSVLVFLKINVTGPVYILQAILKNNNCFSQSFAPEKNTKLPVVPVDSSKNNESRPRAPGSLIYASWEEHLTNIPT